MSFGAGEVLKKTPSGILHLFHSPCKHEVNESFSAVRSYRKAAGRLAYMTLGSPEGSTLTVDDLSTIGNEFSVSCKTYVSALAALAWLGHLVCSHSLEKSRMELDRATAASERYLSRWEETTLTALLKSCAVYGICFLPGVGRRWSHVGIGGLIVKESDHFHAKGMSSATFRRGPFEMLSPETFVLVFAGHESTRALNAGLVRDII